MKRSLSHGFCIAGDAGGPVLLVDRYSPNKQAGVDYEFSTTQWGAPGNDLVLGIVANKNMSHHEKEVTGAILIHPFLDQIGAHIYDGVDGHALLSPFPTPQYDEFNPQSLVPERDGLVQWEAIWLFVVAAFAIVVCTWNSIELLVVSHSIHSAALQNMRDKCSHYTCTVQFD